MLAAFVLALNAVEDMILAGIHIVTDSICEIQYYNKRGDEKIQKVAYRIIMLQE